MPGQHLATFALNARHSHVDESGNRVYTNCRLFQAGNYPDKKMDVTPENLAQMCAATMGGSQVIYGNLEHETDGALEILQGEVGFIREMWIDPKDKTWLRGEVVVPLWADHKLKKKGVSVEIPFDMSQITGYALTYTPRVDKAALMTAAKFAKERYDTWTGQWRLQAIHDMAADGGAICTQAKELSAKHEVAALQSIHDMAVEHGAECDGGAGRYYSQNQQAPSGRENVMSDKKKVTLSSLWSALGFGKDEVELVDDTVAGSPVAVLTVAAPAVTPGVVDFTQTAEYQELVKLRKEKEEAGTQAATRFAADNDKAVQKLVDEKKIKPTDKPGFMDQRAQNPAMFDLMAARWTALPELVGGQGARPGQPFITGDQAVENLSQDPKAQGALNGTVNGLRGNTYSY